MPVVFDTLSYARRLKAAGVAEAQAEAHAEALAAAVTESIATKQDVLSVKEELHHDIQMLGQELRRQLHELENRLTIRTGTIVTAGIGVVVALVKLL